MHCTATWIGLSLARLVALASATKKRPLTTRQVLSETFEWSSITPSVDIEYHDCYKSLQCARLLVPLDWSENNSTEGLGEDDTVAIALVKIPAAVSQDDPSFGGSILYNPGGPGNSGTEGVRLAVEVLPSLLNGRKHFDIIGFDPRGVGATTPPIRCYQDDTRRAMDNDIISSLPPVDAGTLALQYHLQAFKGFWDICLEANNQLLPHATTASVARDMLEIVNKLPGSKHDGKNGPKLQYYGRSYGTYLGATFVSMFPDRVGLMLLDSVVHVDAWRTGMHSDMFNSLEDAVDTLWKHCFSLQGACPLWKDTDLDATDVKKRVHELLVDLQASPVVVGIHDSLHFLTPSKIRSTLFSAVYFIRLLEPSLQDTLRRLAAVVSGDYGPWWYGFDGENATTAEVEDPLKPGSETSGSRQMKSDLPTSSPEDSFHVIRCLDSYDLDGGRERNMSWAQEIVDAHISKSPTLGAAAVDWSLRCYGLPSRWKPKYMFNGAFGAPAPVTSSNKTTAAPVLLINNRIDPVTPLSGAYHLSKYLEGSRVVVQEAAGHDTIGYAGDCLRDVFQAYFNEGVLPINGTVCAPGLDSFPIHI